MREFLGKQDGVYTLARELLMDGSNAGVVKLVLQLGGHASRPGIPSAAGCLIWRRVADRHNDIVGTGREFGWPLDVQGIIWRRSRVTSIFLWQGDFKVHVQHPHHGQTHDSVGNGPVNGYASAVAPLTAPFPTTFGHQAKMGVNRPGFRGGCLV